MAMALLASGASTAAVRARISADRVVGAGAADRWVTAVRWMDAARSGRLFGVLGLDGLTRRAAAEHVTLALAARAGRRLGEDLTASAFEGAQIAA